MVRVFLHDGICGFSDKCPLSRDFGSNLACAANGRFPEGFSMRAVVQHFLPAGRAARVDKPRKEEAAGVLDQTMEKEH